MLLQIGCTQLYRNLTVWYGSITTKNAGVALFIIQWMTLVKLKVDDKWDKIDISTFSIHLLKNKTEQGRLLPSNHFKRILLLTLHSLLLFLIYFLSSIMDPTPPSPHLLPQCSGLVARGWDKAPDILLHQDLVSSYSCVAWKSPQIELKMRLTRSELIKWPYVLRIWKLVSCMAACHDH